PGETKLEVDRRRIRRRLAKVRADLGDVERTREIKRNRRVRSGVPQISLVGYTNSGKSTLLNALTGAGVLVEDRLFSTLDPTARRLDLPDGRHAVLTDTVGFVKKLPHTLVEAFRSTLEETGLSDLLLHVVDASQPDPEAQMDAVARVLGEIGASQIPTILAFNKRDLISEADAAVLAARHPGAVFISAARGDGLEDLLATLGERVAAARLVVDFEIPFDRGDVRSHLHEEGDVLEETFESGGYRLQVRTSQDVLARFSEFPVNGRPSPDHAVALHPKHEVGGVVDEVLRDGERSFLDLLGKRGRAGGDGAVDGQGLGSGPLRMGVGVLAPPHLDGPGLGRVPPQVATVLQGLQVGVHGARGGQADGLADLSHGRRVAPLFHARHDVVQDGPLPLRQV